jgi:hypothetical protein
MRCSDGLVERVDLARGDVPRERWLRRAVEQALGESKAFGTHASPLGGEPAPAEQPVPEAPASEAPRAVMLRSPRVRPDVRPFQRK